MELKHLPSLKFRYSCRSSRALVNMISNSSSSSLSVKRLDEAIQKPQSGVIEVIGSERPM